MYSVNKLIRNTEIYICIMYNVYVNVFIYFYFDFITD